MSDDFYILRLLDECREEIKISDSKASIIFAAVATATALLTNLLLDDTRPLRTNGAAVTTLSVLSVVTLVASMGMLGLAVIPRVGRPEAGKARYFEEQAQFETPEALIAAVAIDEKAADQRHAHQLLTLSRIARRKYGHLRRAMMGVTAATMVMGLAVLVSAVSSRAARQSGQGDTRSTNSLTTIDRSAPVARPQRQQSEPDQQQRRSDAEGEMQVGGIADRSR